MQEEPFGCGLCKKAFIMAKYLAKQWSYTTTEKIPKTSWIMTIKLPNYSYNSIIRPGRSTA